MCRVGFWLLFQNVIVHAGIVYYMVSNSKSPDNNEFIWQNIVNESNVAKLTMYHDLSLILTSRRPRLICLLPKLVRFCNTFYNLWKVYPAFSRIKWGCTTCYYPNTFAANRLLQHTHGVGNVFNYKYTDPFLNRRESIIFENRSLTAILL